YNLDMKEYDVKVQKDDDRVRKEKIQQQYIYDQIRILSEQYEKSKRNLQKYYDYNIIDIRYQHDFVAICSFCQYFRSGRTYSLSFDTSTGDEGAYNIYEKERQNGLIISKLDEVIIKLDDILDYQREIQSQLISANNKIKSLSSEIENSSTRLTSAINQHSAIEQYNGECIQRELAFNNTMNAIFSWH
ncbi:MAG: hypothetical protein J1E41_02580, partial [Ruminococcus sp.]|nr:hypothetical protein [Ruminococcus sp.]